MGSREPTDDDRRVATRDGRTAAFPPLRTFGRWPGTVSWRASSNASFVASIWVPREDFGVAGPAMITVEFAGGEG
jgi:hypothetical protein